jgi:hypothetical protein
MCELTCPLTCPAIARSCSPVNLAYQEASEKFRTSQDNLNTMMYEIFNCFDGRSWGDKRTYMNWAACLPVCL